jgi:hypothetical protein
MVGHEVYFQYLQYNWTQLPSNQIVAEKKLRERENSV